MSSQRETMDASPKARVTSDDRRFQVEFDVPDYRPEELSIKTEGDVLVVLARREDKSAGGSSYVSRQFEQRFTLPSGVRPDSVVSSLSKAGVLTVSAPRDPPSATSTPITGFKKSRGSIEEATGNATAPPEEGLPHPTVTYDADRFEVAFDCRRYKPEELDVRVEGQAIVVTARRELREAAGTRTRIYEQKFTLPPGVLADRLTSSIDKAGVLTVRAPRDGGKVPAASSSADTIVRRLDSVMSPSNWSDSKTKQTATTTTTFGADASRDLFRHGDALDCPDGVSRVEMADGVYKILVNAANFKPEELVIRTIGNSVRVEAKHEEESKADGGGSYSSRNFTQSFSLPRGVCPDDVTSILSKDGTLTIQAPLPPDDATGSERVVPIKQQR